MQGGNDAVARSYCVLPRYEYAPVTGGCDSREGYVGHPDAGTTAREGAIDGSILVCKSAAPPTDNRGYLLSLVTVHLPSTLFLRPTTRDRPHARYTTPTADMKFAPELLAIAAMVGNAAVRADDTFPVMTPPPYNLNSTSTTTYDAGPTTTTTYPADDGPTQPPTCDDGSYPDCAVVAATAIPGCAYGCFLDAANLVGCGETDYACQCATREKFGEILLPCITAYCGEDDVPDVLAGANEGESAVAPPSPSYHPLTQARHEVCECVGGSGNCGGSGGHPTLPTTYPESTSTKEPEGPTYTPYPTCGGDGPKCPDDTYPTDPCTTSTYPTDKYPTDKYPTDHYPTDKYPHDGPDYYPTGGPDKYPHRPTTCHDVTLTYHGSHPTGHPGYPTSTPGPVHPCKDVADKVEDCAKACFAEVAPKIGCALDDYACQCSSDSQTIFEDKWLPCVTKACDAKVLPNLFAQTAAVCECALKDYDDKDYDYEVYEETDDDDDDDNKDYDDKEGHDKHDDDKKHDDKHDDKKHKHKPKVIVTTTCYPVGPDMETHGPKATPGPTYKSTTTGASKPVVTAGAVGRFEMATMGGVLGAMMAIAAAF